MKVKIKYLGAKRNNLWLFEVQARRRSYVSFYASRVAICIPIAIYFFLVLASRASPQVSNPHTFSRWCLHNENTFSSSLNPVPLACSFSFRLPLPSCFYFQLLIHDFTWSLIMLPVVCYTRFTYVCLRWDTFRFCLLAFLGFACFLLSPRTSR